ncbi:methyl-accepting chemotaxis protein [Natrialbaceae archaeon GCM10025810]|uniref:methyl-accepting chemotaxis protein n=1 Tax=Halovalidus salilacus TaxID=3075124 RepID=UPI00360B543A
MSIRSKLVPSFVRRRYLVKFVVSILAVTLVIAAVGAVGYAQIDATVTNDANGDVRSTSEGQAESIGDWVDTMRVQTRTVSASEQLSDGDVQTVQGRLVEEQARLSVDVRSIHYVDTDSDEVVTSTDAGLRGSSLESVDEPWAEANFQEELFFDDDVWNSETAYRSEVLDDQVMAFASPVSERDDRVVVVIGTLEYRVSQLHESDDATSTIIVDEEQNAVLRPEEASFDESNLDEDAVQTALGGRITVSEADGAVRAYAPVGDTQWVAITSVPTDTAYAVANEVGQTVLAIVGVSLLTLGLVGVVLGRQTVGPLVRLRDRAAEMEEGNLHVDLGTNRVDEIGRLYDGFDSMRTSLRDQIEEAESAREEAETAREASERMNRHLEAKADEYRTVMEDCAAGDLTRRLDPESENEAMTDIALAFNAMVEELEATTAALKRFATDVATSSEEVTASSEEVLSASEQVSRSVQEISDGAERQNENLRAVSSEMGGLSTTTEQIAASSNQVADIAARTAEAGRRGRESARDAIEGMHEIESESTEAVEAIEALEAEMEQIDDLVEFISEVAHQTNMLALNANIEASRGANADAGEGFSVVASQVKELAADTKETAADIEARLERIDERTEHTAAEVQRTAEKISAHVESVENALAALDEIAEYAAQTNDGVQEISAASEEQAASTQEVVAMVSTATDISDKTAAEAQQVAAAAEEQTSSMTEVSDSASSLADRSMQLQEALDRFETAPEPDPEFAALETVDASDDAPNEGDGPEESVRFDESHVAGGDDAGNGDGTDTDAEPDAEAETTDAETESGSASTDVDGDGPFTFDAVVDEDE